MDNIDIKIFRRDDQWKFELIVDGKLFATGSDDSLIGCAETAHVIVIDKIDLPSSFLAEFDHA